MNRIISKEEERRYPRRDTSIFEYSVSTHNPSILQELQCFHTQSSNPKFPQIILHTELILLQEISKKYYNYKAHPVHTDRRHPPASVPHVSKHSTRQNKTPGVVIGKTPPSKKPSPLQEHKMFACRYLIRRGVHRKMVITTVYLTVRCMSLT